MTLLLLGLFAAVSMPQEFTSIDGFSDLEEYSIPNSFGLLLVMGNDEEANYSMALTILNSIDSLPQQASVDLWCIDPDAGGYLEIASLAVEYQGFPATVVLVGHCGFLELDPVLLSSEILDSWFTWGDPDSRMTGICNFCRRCNPTGN